MLRGIDHIAIAVADPDGAAAALEDQLGLAVQGGGRHEGLGTTNRIAWLADSSYLELIGVEDEVQAGGWAMGAAAVTALKSGGGFAAYALDDRPLEPDVRALQVYGSQIGDPVRGSRKRSDGEVVEWWTAHPPRIGPEGLPILIEHVMVGAEWGAEVLDERATYRHPIGSPVRLVGLDLAVEDPASAAAEHSKQLGMAFYASGDLAVCSIGQHVVRLVPRANAAAPAVITLAAEAPTRRIDLFGVRFAVEQAEVSPAA